MKWSNCTFYLPYANRLFDQHGLPRHCCGSCLGPETAFPVFSAQSMLPSAPDVPGRNYVDYVAKQPPRARHDGFGPRRRQHRFQHPQDRDFYDLDVSIPESIETLDELFSEEARNEKRWIFTPSYNRCEPGRRQALLDRSSALREHVPDPAVGKR